VAGVVGRAECLSSVFFLTSFMSYRQFAISQTQTSSVKSLLFLVLSLFLCLCSVLSKEQGITVLAVCLSYEYFIIHNNTLKSSLSLLRNIIEGRLPQWMKHFILHVVVLLGFLMAVMVIRVTIMKAELPVFTVHDNPAVGQLTPYRQLHWLYLVFQNAWLLLNPSFLCADWTMGTVPLIISVIDVRNILTLITFASIVSLGLWSINNTGPLQQGVLFGLSLLIFPFVPASNLLFPVGFVVAERILYVPSMGFSILLAIGTHKLLSIDSNTIRTATKIGMVYLLIFHSAKTVVRNRDWKTNFDLFSSAIKINTQNAKLYSNLGYEYEYMNNYTSAESLYRYASEIQPDDIGSFINLGRILKLQERFSEAEKAYRTAIDMMPKGKRIRVAPAHINVFFNLANLIKEDPSRSQEALSLYRKAISMRPTFLEAYLNMGDMLLKANQTASARDAFIKALEINQQYPDAYFNLGTTYIKLNEQDKAENSYRKAISLDPQHKLSIFNLAMILNDKRDQESLMEAKKWYLKLVEIDPTDEKVHFQLGILSTDLNDMTSAKTWFKNAIEIMPSYRAALYNLGFLNYKDNQFDLALKYLTQLREYHPDHVKGMQILGDVLIHFKRFKEAKEAYLLCLKIDPNHITATHNLGVAMTELGDFVEAARLFHKTLQLDPHHEAAKRHLKGAQIKLAENKK
jgi:tetratricopeptide (TPR) repeat protein